MAEATTDAGIRTRRGLRRAVAASLLAFGASLLAFGASCAPGAPEAPEAPETPTAFVLPDERTFLREVDRTRGRKDDFVALRDPPFVAAAEAPWMADDEMVLALDLGAARVCYPTRHLDHHEIVEHSLAGLELLACW